MELEILTVPDAKLRRIAGISEPQLQADLIDQMFKIMQDANGIGLAATQLGCLERVIVMDVDPLEAYESVADVITHGKFELINPEFSVVDDLTEEWHEGCLSVPNFVEMIQRHAVIDVTGFDRTGQSIKFRAGGLLAACVQHEIDHLNGKLFIDRLSTLRRDIILRKLKKAVKLNKPMQQFASTM